MEKFFKRIIPTRRSKRSLLGTTGVLIAVLLLINYLLKVAQAG